MSSLSLINNEIAKLRVGGRVRAALTEHAATLNQANVHVFEFAEETVTNPKVSKNNINLQTCVEKATSTKI